MHKTMDFSSAQVISMKLPSSANGTVCQNLCKIVCQILGGSTTPCLALHGKRDAGGGGRGEKERVEEESDTGKKRGRDA